MRVVTLVTLLMLMSACWNGDVSNVRLGDISLGQQLIDLKRALDEGAIDSTEHAAAKERLLALHAFCEGAEQEDAEAENAD